MGSHAIKVLVTRVVVEAVNHVEVVSRDIVVVGHVCLLIKHPSTTILGTMGQHQWCWVQWVVLDLVDLDHVVGQMLHVTFVASRATTNVTVGHFKGSSSSMVVEHVVVHHVDVVVVVGDH